MSMFKKKKKDKVLKEVQDIFKPQKKQVKTLKRFILYETDMNVPMVNKPRIVYLERAPLGKKKKKKMGFA